MASLRNCSRPSRYKKWLADSQLPVSKTTLHSRNIASQRQLDDQHQDVDVEAVDADQHSPTTEGHQDEQQTDSFEAEDAEAEELLPNGNEYIYPGSSVKRNELLLLILAFVLRFRLTAAAFQALLSILSLILPGCIPTTNYLLEKLFGFDTTTVESHYFCSNPDCRDYFGLNVPDKCSKCNVILHRNSSLCDSMFVLPLSDQLKSALRNSTNFECIFGRNVNSSDNSYSEVVDGEMYKETRGRADITLQFNCDGAPIFHSSQFSIWPLICCINELPAAIRSCNMLLHTLWYGRVKPCAATFLEPFVSEITKLYNEGFLFRGRQVFVNATLCICDAPARALVQEFTQFNGRFGCGFCTHPGVRVKKGHGSVHTYPMNKLYRCRNHEETLSQSRHAVASGKPVSGVKGVSLLMLLPNFDIIRCFVPDYMHCVLLGVVRQFLCLWTDSSSHAEQFYIKNVKSFDKLLKSISPPDEIRRLPRSLSDRKFWKASEYFSFLLLYSPVLLSYFVPRRFFIHWLLLVNGIRLLMSNVVTSSMIATSRKCLHKFIVLIPDLYGASHVSYNVHLLSHLPDAVQNWGPIWTHSAFVYEDTIGSLKRMYHGTQLIPKQIFKYFTAWKKLNYFSPLLSSADDSVVTMYKNLCDSSRSVRNAFKCETFVGLRKCKTNTLRQSLLDNIKGYLHVTESENISMQSYCRFLINRVTFSTEDYSRYCKRNNYFVLLNTGCFADIKHCLVVKSCSCTEACACSYVPLLIVACYLSVPAHKKFDNYVGVDLHNFVRKVCDTEQRMIVISPNDVVCKCLFLNIDSNCYALPIPKSDVS